MFQSRFYANTTSHNTASQLRDTRTCQLPLQRRVLTAASQGVAVTMSGVLAQIHQSSTDRVFGFLYFDCTESVKDFTN